VSNLIIIYAAEIKFFKSHDLCDANQALSALINIKPSPKMTFDTCNMYTRKKEENGAK